MAIVTNLQVQSGLLALVVTANEGSELVVRAADHELTLDAGNPGQAIAAIHRLLRDTAIFIPSEKAGL
jgi:hypothetical protein